MWSFGLNKCYFFKEKKVNCNVPHHLLPSHLSFPVVLSPSGSAIEQNSCAAVQCFFMWIFGLYSLEFEHWEVERVARGRYAGRVCMSITGRIARAFLSLMLLLSSSLPHVWFCKRRRLLNMILTDLDVDTQSISIVLFFIFFYNAFFLLRKIFSLCHTNHPAIYTNAVNHAGFYDRFAFLFATWEEKVPPCAIFWVYNVGHFVQTSSNFTIDQ